MTGRLFIALISVWAACDETGICSHDRGIYSFPYLGMLFRDTGHIKSKVSHSVFLSLKINYY